MRIRAAKTLLKISTVSLTSLASLVFFSIEATAQDCQKGGPMSPCLSHPQLTWTMPEQPALTIENLRKGPGFSPDLTEKEISTGTVFCQYFFHQFSSPGSAKFLCAKTNSAGQLLNKDGEAVANARSVSTREMKLTVQLNGEAVNVDEGVLLDDQNKPIVISKTTKSGKTEEELVEADELKVKYFVDESQYSESDVSRSSRAIQLNNGEVIERNGVFEGPYDVSNPRWNEVFTEVAGTRIFWSLGLPADRMYPMQRLVCFGCDSHPMKQKQLKMNNTSLFYNVSLEKRMKGTKLGEGFEFNELLTKQIHNWSPQTRIGLEVLALGTRLIGFDNAIPLQNRLQCLPNAMDKKTGLCSAPVGIIQDAGSSFAAVVSKFTRKMEFNGDSPRGSLKYYSRESVFSDASSCQLMHGFGNDERMERVSQAGLNEMKVRLANITPEYVREIFTIARFGDMEPGLRGNLNASDVQAKREKIINDWTAQFMKRVQEIRQAQCQ